MAKLQEVHLGQILEQKGFTLTLFSTYNANLEFFEKYILGCLKRGGCHHSILLMDAKMSVQALEESPRTKAGVDYLLHPVAQTSAFHPKLILLLGEKRARIIVGSHNLSLSGYRKNRELTGVLDLNPQDAHDVQLASYVFHQFAVWMGSNKSNQEHLEVACKAAPWLLLNTDRPPRNCPLHFGGPYESTSIAESSGVVRTEPQSIVTGGAFFDQDCAWIQELTQTCSDVRVLVEPETVQLTPLTSLMRKHFYKMPYVQNNKANDGDEESEPQVSAYLHAKWLYLKYKDAESKLLIGSANPSRPGWMAVGEKANTEAMLLIQGARADKELKKLGIDGTKALPLSDEDWSQVQKNYDESVVKEETVALTPIMGVWHDSDLHLPLGTTGVGQVLENGKSIRSRSLSVTLESIVEGGCRIGGLYTALQEWNTDGSPRWNPPSVFWLKLEEKQWVIIANRMELLNRKISTPQEVRIAEALEKFGGALKPGNCLQKLLKEIVSYADEAFSGKQFERKCSTSRQHAETRQEMRISDAIQDNEKANPEEYSPMSPLQRLLELFRWKVSTPSVESKAEGLLDENESNSTEDIEDVQKEEKAKLPQKEQGIVDQKFINKANELRKSWKQLINGARDDKRLPVNPGLQKWFAKYQGLVLLILHTLAQENDNGVSVSESVKEEYLRVASDVLLTNPVRNNLEHLKETLGVLHYQSLLNSICALLVTSEIRYEPYSINDLPDNLIDSRIAQNTLFLDFNHYLLPLVEDSEILQFWDDIGFDSRNDLVSLLSFYSMFEEATNQVGWALDDELTKGDLLIPTEKKAPPLIFIRKEADGFRVAAKTPNKTMRYRVECLGVRSKEISAWMHRKTMKI